MENDAKRVDKIVSDAALYLTIRPILFNDYDSRDSILVLKIRLISGLNIINALKEVDDLLRSICEIEQKFCVKLHKLKNC